MFDERYAWRRMASVRGDPFLYADWERVVFLHYTVDPGLVRPHVPAPLELELHSGVACLSVVAVTMRRFRPNCWRSLGWAFCPIAQQYFLNFRTYVRHRDEPGALFLRGWLSRPLGLPLPSGMVKLPYSFASVDYQHALENGMIRGLVRGRANEGAFTYRAEPRPDEACKVCEPGSLAEFAMERYSGFFARRRRVYVFRAWHPAWLERSLDLEIEDDSLVKTAFPWFKEASFAGANFARGFKRVALGRAHRLPSSPERARAGHGLSAFYEMP
jgi:uncharacterized protein YqjF (DUF2071 family)